MEDTVYICILCTYFGLFGYILQLEVLSSWPGYFGGHAPKHLKTHALLIMLCCRGVKSVAE